MPAPATKQKRIQKVFDDSSFNSNLVSLNTKAADKFIDYIVDESTILKTARVIRMNTPRQEIGFVGIGEKIFYPAQKGVALAASKYVEAATSKITLISKEIIGETVIYDTELEDNIEGAAFANHLFGMISKGTANQMEEASLYAIQINDYETEAVDILQQFNGMISRAESSGVIVDASDTATFANRFLDRNKFTALLKSYATKFRKFLDGLFVPTDLVVDYENLYNTNTTTSQGAENRNKFFGRSFIDSPLLSIDRPVPVPSGLVTDLDGNVAADQADALLTSVAGLVVGDSLTFTSSEHAGRSHTATITNIATNTVTMDIDFPYALLDTDVVTEVSLDGADVLWTPKNNMIFGIQRDITIEPKREPELRRTKYVFTMRIDFQVENNDAIGVLNNLKSRDVFT